jgi:membrane protease YdiL (CAAX protease family)
MNEIKDLLKFKKVAFLTPFVQISIMILIFIAIAVLSKLSIIKTGLLFGKPNSFYKETLFAPIYEELIFRGVIFGLLLKNYSLVKSIIFTGLLFGIWHIKNLIFDDPIHVLKQVCYAGLFLSPVLCLITNETKTIWIGSIIHFLNNGTLFLLYYLEIQLN